tara:strand:- start:170 stop:325 length:156 start_codon:yes stop_codon:yes gene_type:complete
MNIVVVIEDQVQAKINASWTECCLSNSTIKSKAATPRNTFNALTNQNLNPI